MEDGGLPLHPYLFLQDPGPPCIFFSFLLFQTAIFDSYFTRLSNYVNRLRYWTIYHIYYILARYIGWGLPRSDDQHDRFCITNLLTTLFTTMIMITFMADLQNLYQRRWKEPQKLEKIYLIMWCMLVKAPDICPFGFAKAASLFLGSFHGYPTIQSSCRRKMATPNRLITIWNPLNRSQASMFATTYGTHN